MKTNILFTMLSFFICQTYSQEISLEKKISAAEAGYNSINTVRSKMQSVEKAVAKKVVNSGYTYETYTYTGKGEGINYITNKRVPGRSYKAINIFVISGIKKNKDGTFFTLTRYIEGEAAKFCKSRKTSWTIELFFNYKLNYNNKSVSVRPRISHNSRISYDYLGNVCFDPWSKYEENVANFKKNVSIGVKNLITKILNDLSTEVAINSSFNNLEANNKTVRNIFTSFFDTGVGQIIRKKRHIDVRAKAIALYKKKETPKKVNIISKEFYASIIKESENSKQLEKEKKINNSKKNNNSNNKKSTAQIAKEKQITENASKQLEKANNWIYHTTFNDFAGKYFKASEYLDEIKEDILIAPNSLLVKYNSYRKQIAKKTNSLKSISTYNKYNAILKKKAHKATLKYEEVFLSSSFSVDSYYEKLVAWLNENNRKLIALENTNLEGFIAYTEPNTKKSAYKFTSLKFYDSARGSTTFTSNTKANKNIYAINYIKEISKYYIVYEDINDATIAKDFILKDSEMFASTFEQDIGKEINQMLSKGYKLKKIVPNSKNYFISTIYQKGKSNGYAVKVFDTFDKYTTVSNSYYWQNGYKTFWIYFNKTSEKIYVIYEKLNKNDYLNLSAKSYSGISDLYNSFKDKYSIYSLNFMEPFIF